MSRRANSCAMIASRLLPSVPSVRARRGIDCSGGPCAAILKSVPGSDNLQGGLYEFLENPFGFELGFIGNRPGRLGPEAAHDVFGGQASVQGTNRPRESHNSECRLLQLRVCRVHEDWHLDRSRVAHQLASDQEVEACLAPRLARERLGDLFGSTRNHLTSRNSLGHISVSIQASSRTGRVVIDHVSCPIALQRRSNSLSAVATDLLPQQAQQRQATLWRSPQTGTDVIVIFDVNTSSPSGGGFVQANTVTAAGLRPNSFVGNILVPMLYRTVWQDRRTECQSSVTQLRISCKPVWRIRFEFTPESLSTRDLVSSNDILV